VKFGTQNNAHGAAVGFLFVREAGATVTHLAVDVLTSRPTFAELGSLRVDVFNFKMRCG
jgi:hypothetical protein